MGLSVKNDIDSRPSSNQDLTAEFEAAMDRANTGEDWTVLQAVSTTKTGKPSLAMFFPAPAAVAALAVAMEKEGALKEKIYEVTGAWRGADGHWRIERFSPTSTSIGPKSGVPGDPWGSEGVMTTLGAHVDQPHVYRRFPELAKLPLRLSEWNAPPVGRV
jgi:hypothetical protein